jgi:hypothetical protein
MTTGVGATVITQNAATRDLTSGSITTSAVSTASAANYTLYYDSTNGKMYSDVDNNSTGTTLYSGQSDK